ncbi:MAG: hypothetical protein K2G97_04925, partial [Oscillospiraceae bacterium]|nr:hypothetical protein [Oscillospiraceae bacterium]
MSKRNRTPEEKARREKIRELLQLSNIGSMADCTGQAAQSRILCKRRNAVKIGKINLGGSG